LGLVEEKKKSARGLWDRGLDRNLQTLRERGKDAHFLISAWMKGKKRKKEKEESAFIRVSGLGPVDEVHQHEGERRRGGTVLRYHREKGGRGLRDRPEGRALIRFREKGKKAVIS